MVAIHVYDSRWRRQNLNSCYVEERYFRSKRYHLPVETSRNNERNYPYRSHLLTIRMRKLRLTVQQALPKAVLIFEQLHRLKANLSLLVLLLLWLY